MADEGMVCFVLFFFKQKTAYEMRISDWSSDVCSSDLYDLPEMIARIHPRMRLRRLRQRKAHVHRRAQPSLLDKGPYHPHQLVRHQALECHGSRPQRRSGQRQPPSPEDRKSVVSGKRVSVGVDLVVRRIIKKNKETTSATG